MRIVHRKTDDFWGRAASARRARSSRTEGEIARGGGPRRREILTGIIDLHPTVTIFRAGSSHHTDLVRRERCLRALVQHCARTQCGMLCLERDETLVRRDRQWLIEATRAAGARDLAYRHEAASSEALLAIPDAVAWAWARGGDWRRRCHEIVTRVVDV